jgi:hypothetical protein
MLKKHFPMNQERISRLLSIEILRPIKSLPYFVAQESHKNSLL